MRPRTLDHVAVWLVDRDAVADFATRYLGMHVIERNERFTLVGADARRGKLTLFAAEEPRERGALKHVALRVSDLADAVARLPEGTAADAEADGGVYFDVAEGLRIGLIETDTDLDYDLDHVALYTPEPEATARRYLDYGFAADGGTRVEVGGAFVEFHAGDPGAPERPLLHHIAVLVDSADEHLSAAEDRGIEVDDVVDAPNTLAVFLWGPDRVRVEYVEHKPTFSLT